MAVGFLAAIAICVPISDASAQEGSVQSTEAQEADPYNDEAVLGLRPTTVPPEGSVGGMGDINLYPRRIIVDRRQRVATVGLYNRVAATGEYEISVRDLVMTPEGGLVPTDAPDASATLERLNPASDMLRWSPRRVRLAGNEAQTVRVMARPPADLPDGEYRSHFTVISVPETDEGLTIEQATGAGSGGEGIGVVIRPRFAISIPVIVRIGETTLDVGIEAATVVETASGVAIRLRLTRAGTRSAYGDVVVSADGAQEPVAIARGVGIYPEVDYRDIELFVRPDLDPALLQSGRALTISFVDDDVSPGETLASQDILVP
ncbi:hypothetical protein [Aurantiacibacter aquimixticola]|uniref:Molecular chaperone n=1 Tax=Aurantiacibacter aquimixticola TaxID=1958945 RepID=A0A419RTR5_9SPHN|nr:hypothetical protein [Aurantiacibacter aquimixticola]RJY09144.1 hypothetical protein D6201_07020 [Aurantiacibacter aquimixticola]